MYSCVPQTVSHEVGKPDVPGHVEQDVLWLEVVEHDVDPVEVAESGDKFSCDEPRLGLG